VVLERRAPVPNAQVQVQVPEDPDERSAWLVAGARRLGQTLREVGPAIRVWSWSEDQTARFWLRRTTHDTLVHRVDAELAVGREVTVDPTLAADLRVVLTRRADPASRVEVAGDEPLFAHWLDHSRF
jgi:uncharacterized protein (TIGR03083 family)